MRHVYRFVPDAYVLTRRPRCDDRHDPRRRADEHRLGKHPVPDGWDVTCSPGQPVLLPGEQATIQVDIEPPAGWAGTQTVNVNAFHEHGLAGGMTFTVTR